MCQRTFYAQDGTFFFATERVDGLDDVFALVLHLGTADSQFVVVTRILGHVLETRIKQYVLEMPFKISTRNIFTAARVGGFRQMTVCMIVSRNYLKRESNGGLNLEICLCCQSNG